jgi:hypothetical protein
LEPLAPAKRLGGTRLMQLTRRHERRPPAQVGEACLTERASPTARKLGLMHGFSRDAAHGRVRPWHDAVCPPDQGTTGSAVPFKAKVYNSERCSKSHQSSVQPADARKAAAAAVTAR